MDERYRLADDDETAYRERATALLDELRSRPEAFCEAQASASI